MTNAESTTLIDVPMPQLGSSVTEGTVLEWNHEVGDRIEAGDVLCEISTDKVDSELPAPVGGTLAEILVPSGETVEVGTLLARISSADEPGSPSEDDGPSTDSGQAQIQQSPPAAARRATAAEHGEPAAARRFSPLVRRIAADRGIVLSEVDGTGLNGRVTKGDVLAHLERIERSGSAEPAGVGLDDVAPGRGESRSEPLSRMRISIAEHMMRSRATAAHCHTWIEVDMGRIEVERAALETTALPLVAHATVKALGAHPALNASISADERILHADVNLGIAVSLGEEGLIVPVVHRAQTATVEDLDARVRDLAAKAREKRLAPDDVVGGTFTITSQGRYGTLMSAPIINQPEVAILDLQTITKRPVVAEGPDGADAIAIRPMTILGLSWDHRAIDGAQAAEFLATVRENLERWDPQRA